VAVTLLPVDGALLVIRRSIEPRIGELALPGGVVDLGETWQEAAARELLEETGVRADPQSIELFGAKSAPDVLLVFGLAPPTTVDALPPSGPTAETQGWELLTGPAALAFPLHTAAAAEYFAGKRRGPHS
jgi:ADP-ribose pyrophosphatase YjhB (NUDIX family)